MQIEDIGEALKLKISKERVGAELEKMLRGESIATTDHVYF
jgi:tRNA nucleotidyltransferase/poly(A) polymerase